MGRVNKRAQAAKQQKNGVSNKVVSKAKASTTPLLLEKPTLKSIKSRMSGSASKVTKKDKLRIKKNHLQHKLKKLKVDQQELKNAAKRKKKAVIGDLKPIQETLKDILNEVNCEGEKSKQKKEHSKKPPGHSKQKKKQNQMQRDLSIFQQVLAHPEYVQNPFNTISTHIENKMIMESMN